MNALGVKMMDVAAASKCPTVLCLCIHSAHYVDRALNEITEAREIELHCGYLSSGSGPHPYIRSKRSGLNRVDIGEKDSGVGIKTGWKMIAVARELRPDVIVVFGHRFVSQKMILAWARLTNVPIIYAADTVELTMGGWSGRFKRKIATSVVRALADALWVPGEMSRRYFEARGVPAARVVSGYYSLDMKGIIGALKEREVIRRKKRTELGIGDRETVVLFVGRLVEQRGLEFLIGAWMGCAGRDKSRRLVVVGSGPEESMIKGMLEGANCRNVMIRPPVDYDVLGEYYAASDIYVQPSIYEPYSLSLLEAAARGLICVSTDVVGASLDIELAGDPIVRVRTRDVDALAKGLAKAFQMYDERPVMREGRICDGGQAVVNAADGFVRAVSIALGRQKAPA